MVVRVEGTGSQTVSASRPATPKRGLVASLGGLAFRIGGKLVGGGLVNSLGEMQRAQWLSTEELLVRTQARLASLLKHAAEHVPFYREAYRNLGLAPDELKSVAQLSALPVLSKADYRERFDDFNADNIPEYRRLDKSTSGSTGEPFRFSLDRRALPVIFASHLFYDSWHDLGPFDRYIRLVSPPAPVPAVSKDAPASFRLRSAVMTRVQQFYENLTQEKFQIWEVNPTHARDIWARMEKFRPRFVLGYTSTLAAVADELLMANLRLTRPVAGVITIAETLSPPRRHLIDKYFGAPIINRYGLRELGSWSAQSCRESPDQFHVNTELVVCEILRVDGSPCLPGETGRVVLTDLHNYARPLIRYATGDLAVASSGRCGCGRGFPMIGQIEGRSQECLRTPSGKQISPAVLGHYLFVYNDHLHVIRHYQLVQESADRVRLLVVPTSGWSKTRREKLLKDLTQLLGSEMQMTIQTVTQIEPEKSGKRPIIKIASW